MLWHGAKGVFIFAMILLLTTPVTNATTCPPGMGYDISFGYCSECSANTFSPGGVYRACSNCASGSASGMGASVCILCNSISNAGFGYFYAGPDYACGCNAGFYGWIKHPGRLNYETFTAAQSGGTCTACAAGKYDKVAAQDIEWSGGWVYRYKSTEASTCAACPAGKTSSAGSISCYPTSCPTGQYVSGTSCVACEAGKYKATTGTEICTACPPGSSSNPGATACFLCNSVPNAQTITGGYYTGLCGCNNGYYGRVVSPGYDVMGDNILYSLAQSGGTCHACAAGKYAHGSDDLMYWTSENICNSCPAGKTSPPGSTSCPLSTIPLSCPTGQYLPSTSSSSCVACAAGKFKSDTGTQACNDCFTNSLANDARTDCLCNVGYRYNGFCVSCGSGSFKNTISNDDACTSCPVGSISSIAAATCIACSAGTYRNTNTKDVCINCPKGKYSIGSVDSCTNCPEGKFSDTLGASECTMCSGGKYQQNEGQLDCSDCSANSVFISVTYGCNCNVGYAYNYATGPLACNACEPGTYMHMSVRLSSCYKCPAGKYVGTSGAITCLDCPALSTSVQASSVCTCNAGYMMQSGVCVSMECGLGQTGPAGSCTACAAGKYKSVTGSAACSDCGANTYSTATGATEVGTCTACTSNTQSSLGSTAQTSCVCNLGFTGPNGGACTACVAGKYKTVTGTVSCTDCSANTYSTATGATAVSTCTACTSNTQSSLGSTVCQCNTGYTGPDGGTCTACAAGKYKAVSGSDACTDCSANTYSTVTGANSVSTCQSCPSNTESGLGSTALTSCVCKLGFTGPNGGTCTACQPGQYKSVTGSSNCLNCSADTYSTATGAIASATCQNCPSNTQSAQGSTALTSCVCKLGFTGPGCTLCAAGKYKAVTGSAACDDCAAGKYSAATGQSSSATCQNCAVGTYANLPSSSVCTQCPALSTSPAGSSAVTQCTCNSGYDKVGIDPFVCECSPGFYKPDGPNIAVNKPAFASSSLDSNYGAWRAFDGYSYGYAWQSAMTMSLQWVGVDLQSSLTIKSIRFYPSPGEITGRPDSYIVRVGQSSSFTSNPACASTYLSQNQPYFDFSCVATGQYVSLHRQSGGPMSVFELEVYKGGDCTQCVAGKFKEASGSAACDDCAAGKYSSVTGRTTVCDNCLAGTYSTLTGQSSSATCQNCVAGTYSTLTGQSSSETCQNCLAGTYSTLTGQSSSATCQNCLAGKFSALTGQSSSGTCTDCSAGKFSAATGASISGTCQDCPAQSTSPAGSSSVTSCQCNAGHSGVAGSCALCAAGTYKAVAGSVACVACVQAKYSAAGATMCTNCPPGQMSYGTGNAQCELCPINTWKGSGYDSCIPCFVGTLYSAVTSGPGTTAESSCQCPAGFITGQYRMDSQCKPCRPGTIQPTMNLLAYNYYPSTNHYVTRNDYSDPSLICDQCPAGKFAGGNTSFIGAWMFAFQGRVASSACIDCAAGKYSGEHVAQQNGIFIGTSASTCSDCPADRFSLALSSSPTQCLCAAGYTGPNAVEFAAQKYRFDPCTLCAAGTYKSVLGSAACSSCPLGKTSLPGSTTESNCRDIIKCNAGYTGPDDGICTECSAGSYKPAVGSQSCTLCHANTYGTAVAAIFNTSCVECPAYSTSVAGSAAASSCQCNRGYSGADGGPCEACFAGFFKTTIGSANCSICPVNSFSNNASTVLGSCKCNKGYSGADGGPCIPCNAGFYKNTTGSGLCSACPLNSVSNVSSEARTNCKCNRGYSGADGTQCSSCSAQFYKDTIGSENCTACPTTTVSNIASTALTNCRCNVGYTGPDGSACDMCPAGFFKNTTGSATCSACPIRSFSDNASTALASCKCNRGYSGADGGPCNACSASFYKNTTGSAPCSACPLSSVSDVASDKLTSCKCNQGYHGADGGPCSSCDANFYKDSIGSGNCSACPENSVSQVASTFAQNCKCDSGFSGLDGGVCNECAAGTYKETYGSQACTLCEVNKYGITLAAISNKSCLSCPGNSTSVRGSDKAELCFCAAGFEQTIAFDACIECRPGFYDNLTNRHECSTCSGGLYSAFWGATGIETCKECGAGTWSDIGSPTCQMCPPHSNSSVKSAFLTDCKCLPGATGEDGQTCELCEAGTYKNISGNSTCQKCNENSFSVRGSTSCQCNVGYTGSDNGYCTECAQGTYKNVSGSVSCQSCFLNSDSYPASTARSSCLCKAGYESMGEDNCTACVSGKTKQFGPGKCLGCTEFMVVGDGSCQCNAGYRIVSEGCKACEIGTYKNTFGNSSLATAECELTEKFSAQLGFRRPSCCKCRQNHTTLAAGSNKSEDCVCQPGFEGSKCNACAVGKYKTTISMDACVSCSIGATTLHSGSTAMSTCVAAPGHYGNSTVGFLPCAAGSYAPSPDMQKCLPCASGASSPVGATSSADCGCQQIGYTKRPNVRTYFVTVSSFAFNIDNERRPVLKLYSPGTYIFDQSDESNDGHQIAFKDAKGFEYNTGVKFTGVPGRKGAYTDITISKPLIDVLRYYCIVHGNFMGNALTITDEVICTCEEGYMRDLITGLCQLCPANYYCPGGDMSAQSCPNASYSMEGSVDKTSCQCIAGYTGQNGGPCIACANGSWKALNGSSTCIKCSDNATSPTASRSSAACVCKPGFSGANGGLCLACEKGTYKQHAGAHACSLCSVNTTTREQGSDKYADCLCQRGYEFVDFDKVANTSICAACPLGKYKEAPGHPQICVSCPVNAITVGLGATLLSECVCMSGRYNVFGAQNVSSCQPCPANTFKVSVGNAACTLCATNSFAPSGSNSSTACKCLAEFTGPDGGPCEKCPANSSAPSNSKDLTACLCLPGFTGPNGGPCTQCLQGQYKAVNGSDACTHCTSNTMSPAASKKATDCLCIQGFEGLPGGPCSMCPQSTYAQNGACVPCTANSESQPASAAITACNCNAGYIGPAGGPCTPCGAGLYRSKADTQCVKCPQNTNTISTVAQSVAECQGVAGFRNIEIKAPWVKIKIKIFDEQYVRYTLGPVQANFKKAITAEARKVCKCNVTEEDVLILDAVPFGVAPASRRLLQAYVELTLAIKVPTQLDGEEVSNLLLLSDIISALQVQGENLSVGESSQVLITEDIIYAAPCPANTYKATFGDSGCLSCPTQSISPSASTGIEACTCSVNWIKKIDGSCDRVCPAGFEARTGSNAQTECAPCRVSSYKTEEGEQNCVQCPPNSFSLLTSQTSIMSCMCAQGYVWNAATQLCDACPAGTFNNKHNENVCYLCNTTCPAKLK
jgi:hypothetical protein